MKLIYCNFCRDVIRLHKTTRTCQCGASGGNYREDGLNAVIHGNCQPIGIHNSSFMEAREQQPEYGKGTEFTAFVIPKVCPTVNHVDSEDYESVEDLPQWINLDDELVEVTKVVKLKNVFKNEK